MLMEKEERLRRRKQIDYWSKIIKMIYMWPAFIVWLIFYLLHTIHNIAVVLHSP